MVPSQRQRQLLISLVIINYHLIYSLSSSTLGYYRLLLTH
jgi:hypothetical protein